jgi:hypothetical protein
MAQISSAFNRYRARHGLPFFYVTQRGGSYATIDGKQYYYYTQTDSFARQIYVGGHSIGDRACVVVSIEPHSRVAELQTFESGDHCSVDGSATAQDNLRVALFLAKRERVTRLKLTDEAGKTIDGAGGSPVKLDLSHMYFLATGKSWYEAGKTIDGAGGSPVKFDLSHMYFLATGKSWYEAYIENLVPEDPILVGIWREYVYTNTWDSVLAALQRRAPEGVGVPVPTDDVDTAAAGSAMIIFRRIKEARTDFFARYNSFLPDATRVGPLKGSKWYVDF